MSGITSGLVYGNVTAIDMGVPSSTHTWLYDQVFATYQSDSGDSGAPIFYKDREILPSLWIIDVNGIHVGRYSGNTVFSPQSGVNTDIDATPITYWE